MARQTATTQKQATRPARTGRKPAQGSTDPTDPKPRNARQKRATATGPASDDAIKAIVAATATDDDLTPALAKSVDRAKAKPVVTRRDARKVGRELATERQATTRQVKKTAEGGRRTPTAPKDNGKVDPKPKATGTKATGNGVTFSGRPTAKVETVAARVKEAGLKVRATADVDALATRLRATPDAVRAWLDSRNGQQPAKTTAKAKTTATPDKTPAKTTSTAPKPAKAKSDRKPKEAKPPMIQLGHVWADKKPDFLKGCTLVMRYEVRPDDGTVWTTLYQVLGPDGKVLEDFWRLPLDYRPTLEVQGNGRKVVLKDRTMNGLQVWLIREGLTTPEDITTKS